MPTQTGDQSCALGAVEAAEITLQIVAGIATGSTAGETQTHVHQWTQHVLAEVAGHGPCRNVPTLFRPVGIVELDQQTPVMPLRISGARQNLQRRTHRACLAIVTGIKHAFGCQAKAAGQQIVFGLRSTLGRWFGFNFGWFGRCFFRLNTEQFAAALQLGDVRRRPAFGLGIGRVVTVFPLATLGEHRLVILERRLACEDVQSDHAYRCGANLVQLLGDGVHAAFAAGIVVGPQHHRTAFERRKVGLVPGVRTVGPARGHVAGQQIRCSVGGLFAFAQNDRSLCALRQLIQAQQRTWLQQTLPTPLLRLAIGPLAPGQWRKHLARFAVFIRAQIEAVERHDRLALSIAVHPDF
ncbi:hypothetical protein D3C84_627060 [compost metagenome]